MDKNVSFSPIKQTNFEEHKTLGTRNQLPPAIELATLIRKGVMQDAYSATALSTDQVIPTLFVNRAKGDAAGRLAKIKSRPTLRGDLDPSPAGITRRTYAPVLLPNTMRLPVLQHDMKSNFHLVAAALNNICALHDYQSCCSKFIRATTIKETRQFHKAPSPFQFLTLLGLHGIASPSPIDLTGYAPNFTLRVMKNVACCLLVLLGPTRIWLIDDFIDWYGYSQLIVTHSSAESKLMALDALVRQVQNFHCFLESLQLPVNGPSIINMDVLSETEHTLLRKSSLTRRQQAANIDDSVGRRPQKRAKPGLLQVADAPKTSTRMVPEALSADSDSGDMESSEVESDHIDHSGTPPTSPYTSKDFEMYTWTQPSSPRPPLAAPPVTPAIPAPYEPTLHGTDYFKSYAVSAPASHQVKIEPGLVPDSDDNYQDHSVNNNVTSLKIESDYGTGDSDYGAGLTSASDDDDYERDTSDERLLRTKKLDFIMATVSAYQTQKDPEQHSQQADMPELSKDSINTNKQAQACRPNVDGQSAARHPPASKADD
jgi:hypothetical protein